MERHQTIRQEIITLLESGPATSRDISKEVGIQEKDVCHHLASVEKSLARRQLKLHVQPYRCLACGFEFKKRKTFKRPGKCPKCRQGRIASALYQILR